MLPAIFHLTDLGHVCHRATCIQIRQDNLLAAARQYISALRHEMHAAEHNVFAVGLSCKLREFVGIAGEIRKANHFVALVVMSEDHAIFA